MAPPKLNATLRYFPPETRKYYFVTAIVSIAAPTRGELNAGTDLSEEIAEVAGFTLKTDTVATPDLGNRFTGNVPGRITADDSSMTFYASENSNDVRTVLPRGTTGFIVCLPEGDVAGQLMDVFPITVSAAYLDTATDDPGRVIVEMVITSTPAQNVTIPA